MTSFLSRVIWKHIEDETDEDQKAIRDQEGLDAEEYFDGKGEGLFLPTMSKYYPKIIICFTKRSPKRAKCFIMEA